jgi:hypothetical protein
VCGDRQRLHRPADGSAQAEGNALELQSLGLDLGEVEDVVQQEEQRAGRRLHELQALPLRRRQVGLVENDVGHPDDGVHRGANLVAHPSQELGLGARCGESLLAVRRQLGLRALAVRDLAVRDGDARRPGSAQHRDRRREPALPLAELGGMIEREVLRAPGERAPDCLREAPGGRHALLGGALAELEIAAPLDRALAEQRLADLGIAPGGVGADDPPRLVEDRHAGRQRVERPAQQTLGRPELLERRARLAQLVLAFDRVANRPLEPGPGGVDLRQEVLGSPSERGAAGVAVVALAQRDDGKGCNLPQRVDRVHAVALGQRQIEQDHVEPGHPELLLRLVEGAREGDDELRPAAQAQLALEHPRLRRVVLHQKDLDPLILHHAARAPRAIPHCGTLVGGSALRRRSLARVSLQFSKEAGPNEAVLRVLGAAELRGLSRQEPPYRSLGDGRGLARRRDRGPRGEASRGGEAAALGSSGRACLARAR